jgi:hypothetical protein
MTTPTRTVTLTANEKGAAISKFLVCLHMAEGHVGHAAALAAERCRATPLVEHTLKQMITKGAVGAQALSSTDPYEIGTELFPVVQSKSILLRLLVLARRVLFQTKTSREIDGGAGAWRGEGLPAASTKSTFNMMTMDPFVLDYLTVLTKELFKFGRVAEALVLATVVTGVSRFLDGQALNPTVGLTTSHPASLLYGAQPVTSTGSTAAQIAADLASLIAEIQSSGDALVWTMRSTTCAFINARLASIGYPTTPGFLLGLPVLSGSGSPHQVALLDMANVAVAYDEAMEIDLSTSADIQMDSAPTQSGIAGTGAALVSLFQNGLVGVHASLLVNYQHVGFGTASPTVPAGAAYMTVTY